MRVDGLKITVVALAAIAILVSLANNYAIVGEIRGLRDEVRGLRGEFSKVSGLLSSLVEQARELRADVQNASEVFSRYAGRCRDIGRGLWLFLRIDQAFRESYTVDDLVLALQAVLYEFSVNRQSDFENELALQLNNAINYFYSQQILKALHELDEIAVRVFSEAAARGCPT